MRARKRSLVARGVLAACVVPALFGVVIGSSGASSAPKVAIPKASGGTAYFAELSGAVPNYIFPFQPIQFFSVTNIPQFQYLMYRPLYWFGTGSQPTLNESLSIGNSPKYSAGNTVVSMSVKSYKWSNGEKVTAQDVVFWLNILKVEKLNWAAYSKGTPPDDVKSVTTSGNTVTITLTGKVNPYWFTYNELGGITPIPMAWDISASGQKAGSQACGTASYASVTVTTATTKTGETVTPVSAAAKSCAAVFTYLSEQSGFDPAKPKAANNSLSTYATNPLWQVVDGPWHLAKFDASGNVTMKPNPSYSGPVKAKLASFVELPFTSASSEFNALVGGQVSVGYLPPEDVTATAPSPTNPGANNPRLSNFTIAPWYPWGINYFPYNFNSTGDGGQAGKIFQQLYFRQAFQMLVDENLYIKKLYKNYAVPTYGPVPVLPKNSFATAVEENNPYPPNAAKAIALLKAHGWKVVPGGTDSCIDAAKCHVPVGTKLNFTIQYSVPSATETTQMQAEQSAWAAAGIHITLSIATFDTVIGNAIPCSGASCTWEFENWAGGWTYSPDFYPTGEVLFATGAGSNVGSYSDKTNDSLITGTNFGSTTIQTWENYLTKQLPIVFQPEEAYYISEIQKGLNGVTPQNPLLAINPENWSFSK